MHVNLEVVTIPVSDVDRALEFYHERLGWRVDADIQRGADFRVVQLTPTGSGHVSIAFGVGIPSAPAGSMRHLELVTSDIVATRAIEIDAPPSAIWPWLVQMGPGRAGA